MVELVAVGTGVRGQTFGELARTHLADEARVVAVAEPHPLRRDRFADEHGIAPERRFATWEELVAAGALGEGAVICTRDTLHEAPTVALLGLGYHVLLEKPIATTPAACLAIVQAAERANRTLMIVHGMRYNGFYLRVKEIIASGVLGDVVTVEHRENVAFHHMAHSYVRGHWRRAELGGSMLLAKCCHDLDFLYWVLGPVRRLSSVGGLSHFRRDRAPAAAPARCTDGCAAEEACPFSAIKIYLEGRPYPDVAVPRGVHEDFPHRWPFSVIAEDTTYDGRLTALREGPWGRCVYDCDNDVVDHQLVTMELESGVSVNLAMHGHSHEDYRSMRYDGTRGTLRGRWGDGPGQQVELELHDHVSGRMERFPVGRTNPGPGHDGDLPTLRSFVRVIRGDDEPRTSGRESLESHLMAFAAEQSRLTGTVVDMRQFRRAIEPVAQA